MSWVCRTLVLAFCLVHIQFSCAYIPAFPSNSTKDAIAGGLNITDISLLHLQWPTNGSYTEHVSYQLAGSVGPGVSKGVLVHFSEDVVDDSTPPTSTPWIALISCEKNVTNSSMSQTIFNLARSKGAVSALLYSLTSDVCIISPEYSNGTTFDHIFDIFATQSLTSSHLIEYQFGQLSGGDIIRVYDSGKLNNSATDIARSINDSVSVSAGYLLATLQAGNYTAPGNSTSGNNTAKNSNASLGIKPLLKTALATIILCLLADFATH